MNEKLQTIYSTVEEIRDIVDAECIPLEDLPDEIRRRLREGGGGGGGYTTVFVFSSVDSPGAPVSGKLDVGTGYVENLSEE